MSGNDSPERTAFLRPDTAIPRAYLLFQKHAADELPVHENGRCIGTLKRGDITAALGTPDLPRPLLVEHLMKPIASSDARVLIYSAHEFELPFLKTEGARQHCTVEWTEHRLDVHTALLARGFTVICAFVSDCLDAKVLEVLASVGVKSIALRSAGFNHVDLAAAQKLGLRVARVPAYSPHAVSEHAFAILFTLLRKTHKAYNRVREGNFALDGLMGSEIHGKTVGVLGTGRIGSAFAEAVMGFGADVIACDPTPSQALADKGVTYVSRRELFEQSDILSLHCPLNASTRHIVNQEALETMSKGIVLINTSRGALIDSEAMLRQLKAGHIGALGLDVYEEEEALFFNDHSSEIIQDDVFARFLTFPNVLITGHQGFFTDTALREIAATTFRNVKDMNEASGKKGKSELTA